MKFRVAEVVVVIVISHFINVIALNQKHTSSAGTITNLAQQLKNVTLHVNSQKRVRLGNSRIHSIKTVSGDSVYHELLRKFPDITKPPRPDQEIKHSVVHYIETNSRPVTAKSSPPRSRSSPHRKSGI
ncbi:hypothetical protein TNCV_1697751 [Trichonephila clavipes]|nr:hypothetical protein TNCV_1697751 [Trichonephila clavipes]